MHIIFSETLIHKKTIAEIYINRRYRRESWFAECERIKLYNALDFI